MEEDITIAKSEYEELLDNTRLLNCLCNCGVENWSGWDYAIEQFNLTEGE